MIMLPEIRIKKSAYKSSLGADLRQFGTKLDFSECRSFFEKINKNKRLNHDFAPNPDWENLLYKFCHQSGKSCCFSTGYSAISDCKISLILKVYKWAFHFVYALLYFLPACWLPEMDGRMAA